MTTAGGMAGGSGFEYGDNTVAARLSIDIPTEGVQSLREITQEISRFRTEMEAAARSQGDFIGFFQTLPSIASQAANAFKTYADQLERGLMLQQRIGGAVGQWDVQPGSTPEPFKGMSSGMGRSTGSVGDTVGEMDRLRGMGQAGERQYLNIHGQRGALGGSDIPRSNSEAEIAAATDRISSRERVNQERTGGPTRGLPGQGGGRYGGIAGEIVNEFGSGSGMSGVLRKVAELASKRPSGEVPHPDSGTSGSVGSDQVPGAGGIGAAGALGKLMGVPGAGALGPLAALLGGYNLAQFAGPRLQELRALGQMEGGGIKEGAGLELQSRIMAMSPFLTNDQSRSIIQNALSSGYKSGTQEYETVTKFMAENMKELGISARESMEMVKKHVIEGGLSPDAVKAGLALDKELSKKGFLSEQDRRAARNTLQGSMEDMGVPGNVASRASAQATEMFSGNQILKGSVNDMLMAASDNPDAQATILTMAGIPLSTDFGDWETQLAEGGGEAVWKALTVIARNSGGKRGLFRNMVNQVFGTNITTRQADELLRQIRGGKNEAAAAQQRINEVAGQGGSATSVQDRSGGERFNAGVGEAFSVAGGTLSDIVSLNFDNIPQRFRAADFTNQSEHIPVLDQIVNSQGGDPNKIMVQDASGEWQKLQPKNSEQLKSLAGGGRWRYANDPSSSGYTLADAPTVMTQSQDVNVGGEVTLHVSADPGVKVDAPKTFRLTQNQIRANHGWSTATVNNPPPGDR